MEQFLSFLPKIFVLSKRAPGKSAARQSAARTPYHRPTRVNNFLARKSEYHRASWLGRRFRTARRISVSLSRCLSLLTFLNIRFTLDTTAGCQRGKRERRLKRRHRKRGTYSGRSHSKESSVAATDRDDINLLTRIKEGVRNQDHRIINNGVRRICSTITRAYITPRATFQSIAARF